ncbi:DUF5666 domain-containing protein [Solirubrobacter phytolaccae]|uniref:DUF5666 domain-containing protein n=1 Tax=Solirubrobacter phytolaccae TaxID=1404360 RepID=A0A9X3NDW7_9ACTN|nr:DUF5666 domain-containing protein [Solirubrobacter phytolaccae]MDA0183399.1 DUF5666 domain-containing protein [Solirubrobacter phytolaccae]
MTDEDLLSEPLPVRTRGRLVTGAGAACAAVAIGALGFLGGVHVQKAQGDSAAPGAGRMGAFPGAGGFGGAAGGGQGGQTQSDATTGEVASVDGTTFYVQDASGNTIRVRADEKAKVSRNAVADAEEIHPGDTVVVTGRTASSGTVVATSVVATASNAGR